MNDLDYDYDRYNSDNAGKGSSYDDPAPLLSLPAFLLLVVVEAAWVWVLWQGINYLADRFLL